MSNKSPKATASEHELLLLGDHASNQSEEVKQDDVRDGKNDDDLDTKAENYRHPEIVETLSNEGDSNATDERAHSTSSELSPRQLVNSNIEANGHVRHVKFPNGSPDGDTEIQSREINEILTPAEDSFTEGGPLHVKNGPDFRMGTRATMIDKLADSRAGSINDGIKQTKHDEDDSDYDNEPTNSYQPKITKDSVFPFLSNDNDTRLRCCYRGSDSLQKTFTDLCSSIYNHFYTDLETILRKEDDMNQAKLFVMKNEKGLPCLMQAVDRSSLRCLEILLNTFVKLSRLPVFERNGIRKLDALETKDGRNLFHCAAEIGNDKDRRIAGASNRGITEILKLLEACPLKGDIVDKADSNNATPLIVACEKRNARVITWLVKKGNAKIDHVVSRGNSPINYVAQRESAGLLEMFLKEGCRNCEMYTYASLFINDELYKGTILQALLKSVRPDTLWKCFKNEPEQKLIRECLEIEFRDNIHFLHKICRKPLADLARIALEGHASDSLDTFDDEGMTPLMGAVEEKQYEIVEVILQNEYGRNTVSKTRKYDKCTALMIACNKNHHEIAKLIMQQSTVELNGVDKAGKNVFHIAAAHSNEVLKNIIDVCCTNDNYENYKEILLAEDDEGYTSLHYAAAYGSPENVKLLLDHGVPYDSINRRFGRRALHEAVCSNLNTVKALVDFVEEQCDEKAKKVFIDAADDKLHTSLHLAASAGKFQTVSYLLDHGAAMKCDHEMETPLHLAASSGCTRTVKHLLRCEPSVVNNRNRVGETPVMFAATEGHKEVLQLLLESGARLQMDSNSEKKHKTCLELAVGNKLSDTALVILNHKDWKKDLENSTVGADGLLAQMVKCMPQVASEMLNKCVAKTKDNNAKEYDFFALQTVEEGENSNENNGENNPKKKKKVMSMQTLEAIIKYPHDVCLSHPVVQQFLKNKWWKRVMKWYLAALLLYVIFLISLTTYISLVRNVCPSAYLSHGESCYVKMAKCHWGQARCTTKLYGDVFLCGKDERENAFIYRNFVKKENEPLWMNAAVCGKKLCKNDNSTVHVHNFLHGVIPKAGCAEMVVGGNGKWKAARSCNSSKSYICKHGGYSSKGLGASFAMWICGVCACISLVKEFFKLLYKKLEYLSCISTYVALMMYISVFIFLPYTHKSERQWHAGAVAIFLAWIYFIWLLKRFPAYGIYIIMVKKIFVTLVKVMIPVMFFIMAFAMTFYVLHADALGFRILPLSLVTSFAMMAGETEYHQGFMHKSTDEFGWIIVVFWVISVIVMTILIMNLLTALAVGDTGDILRRSMAEKQLLQATFIVDLENCLTIIPYLGANYLESLKVAELRQQSYLGNFLRILSDTLCPIKFIMRPPDEEQTKSTDCQCPALMEQLAEMKATLSAMQKNQVRSLRLSRSNKRVLSARPSGYAGRRESSFSVENSFSY